MAEKALKQSTVIELLKYSLDGTAPSEQSLSDLKEYTSEIKFDLTDSHIIAISCFELFKGLQKEVTELWGKEPTQMVSEIIDLDDVYEWEINYGKE